MMSIRCNMYQIDKGCILSNARPLKSLTKKQKEEEALTKAEIRKMKNAGEEALAKAEIRKLKKRKAAQKKATEKRVMKAEAKRLAVVEAEAMKREAEDEGFWMEFPPEWYLGRGPGSMEGQHEEAEGVHVSPHPVPTKRQEKAMEKRVMKAEAKRLAVVEAEAMKREAEDEGFWMEFPPEWYLGMNFREWNLRQRQESNSFLRMSTCYP
jgi:uncharacterized protein YcgL (UPF0745 family)